MNNDKLIKEFVKDKTEALSPPLNKEKIIAFAEKYDSQSILKFKDDDMIFWASIHKAVTATPSLPIEHRKESKAWLDKHGLRSLDDGDL